MKIYISQPRGKEKLVQAFQKEGCEVANFLTDDVKLIVPTVDEELTFFARSAEYFRFKGIEVNISSAYTIDICRDKAEFSRFCKRHSFAHPATAQFDAIIKPRFGKGSRGITKIDRSYIVQDIMPFPEYSVDYFASFDGKTTSIVPRKRLNVVNGESQTGEIEMDGIILDTVKRLGEELALLGHNTIQGWFTGKTFVVGEVNCRFGGGFWLTQDAAPTVKWLVQGVKCSLQS